MESAFLIRVAPHDQDRWALADMKYKDYYCFGSPSVEKGETLAVGTLESCYAAARLLDRHVDIIKTGILEVCTSEVLL